MNKKTIDKAAEEYIHRDKTVGMTRRKAFSDGARWRIENAWHDTCEIPEPEKDCLVEYKDGGGNVFARLDWRSEYEWVNACHYDRILRWAYVSDLLPDGKEG